MLDDADIQQFTSDTWSEVLGLDLKPTGRAFKPSTDTITGCVHISGGWQGVVMLVCPVPLARKVAAVMFGLEGWEVTAERQQDAIGELTLLLGGNVKTTLPGESHLSVPAVAFGTSYAVRFPGGECVAEGVFECQGELFQIAVVEAGESPNKFRAEPALAACV